MNLARNDHMFNSKDIELDSKVYVVSKYLPELNSAFLAQNIVNSGLVGLPRPQFGLL